MNDLALALALLKARDLGLAQIRSALPDAPVVSARSAGARRGLVRSWLDRFRVDGAPAPRARRRPLPAAPAGTPEASSPQGAAAA